MSGDCPELSVCIVSWNTRELLRDCLSSLAADPASVDWEIIVVDNASTDGSPDMVVEEFPEVALIASARNLGFSGGSNAGLERATGRCLVILNPDTRVEVGALAGLAQYLDAHPSVGAVGPQLIRGDGSLELSCGRTPSLGSEIVHKLLLHRVFPFFRFGRWNHESTRLVGWVTGACLMVRREAADQVGFLDARMFMCFEDLDWCMRLHRAGWEIAYYPAHRVIHLGGQSIQQNREEMLVVSQQSLFFLFQKHSGPLQLMALRALTVVEMLLRSLVWSGLRLAVPGRRCEARQRLAAYRRILYRTLADPAYWAPMVPTDPHTAEN